jgi:hypothetical protein
VNSAVWFVSLSVWVGWLGVRGRGSNVDVESDVVGLDGTGAGDGDGFGAGCGVGARADRVRGLWRRGGGGESARRCGVEAREELRGATYVKSVGRGSVVLGGVVKGAGPWETDSGGVVGKALGADAILVETDAREVR